MRPRGHPRDWIMTAYYCIILSLSEDGKILRDPHSSKAQHSHMLWSGVDPQIVLDQTHDHLKIVAGTSGIDLNSSRAIIIRAIHERRNKKRKLPLNLQMLRASEKNIRTLPVNESVKFIYLSQRFKLSLLSRVLHTITK